MSTQGNDLTLKIGFDVSKFAADMNKATSKFMDFQNTLTSSLKGFFALETIKRVGDFALEVSRLAGEAEGVREAFDRLPGSVQLMHDLKEATHGTVDELQLMKRSVMASNFDISLKQLPKLLEFATLRAKQTGQSVDYLVDSIVTGIGRKSKLILDNLGISAVQLTEALGGASAASSSIAQVTEAVGKIIEKNLPMMGQLSENASTKLDRLAASWNNVKEAIGKAANNTGILGSVVDVVTERFNLLADRNLSFWDKFNAIFGGAIGQAFANQKAATEELRKLNDEQKLNESITRQAQQAYKDFGDDIKAIGNAYQQNVNVQLILLEVMKLIEDGQKKKASLIQNEKNLTEKLNNLREESTLAIGKERAALNLEIVAIEKQIEALQRLGFEKQKITKFNPDNFGPGGEFPGIVGFGSGPKKKKKGPEGVIGDGPLFDEETFKKTQDRLEAMGRTAARIGDTIGQAFGDMASGARTFAQSAAEMAIGVIDALEKIVLANMIAKSSSLGLPGILLAAAGFGVVKALFRKIGSSTSSSGPSAIGGGFSGGYGGGDNLRQPQLVATVSGRDLNFVLKNQATYDSRVKTT